MKIKKINLEEETNCKMERIERAISFFNKYVNEYDLNIEEIKRKQEHSYRVMVLCEQIAISLSLDNKQIYLCTLIGLLHDIARFEQYKKYQTFVDSKSVDHGEYAIKIINSNHIIKEFVDNEIEYQILKKAIKNHNKFELEENLNQEEIMYAKIVRDADKLDIMEETLNVFFNKEEEKKKIENGNISKEVINQIFARKTVLRKKDFSEIDRLLVYIAFVFDFNFKYTFYKIKERDYVNKTLNKFRFSNKETKKYMQEIKKIVNDYIEQRT